MDCSKEISPIIKPPTVVQPEVMPEPEKAGLYTNKIHHMKKYMLEKLHDEEFAIPFMEPVDTEVLHVPTYYKIIKQPMDLGTINSRVENRYYSCVEDLNNDILLVINNCFTFNKPESAVYQFAQKLEKFFYEVMANLPNGSEIPYRRAKSTIKHQCGDILKQLHKNIEKLAPDDRAFFQDKLMGLSKNLHKHHLKTIKDFDAMVASILKQTQDIAERILNSYKCDCKQPVKTVEKKISIKNESTPSDQLTAGLSEKSKLFEYKEPQFKWKDCLIDALDDIHKYLQQDLATGCQKDKQSYCEVLKQMLINAEIISEGECLQMYLGHPSEDEEIEFQTNIVSEEERRAIHRQFDQLSPQSMYEIMHMIEQSEYGCISNSNGIYNVMYFKSKTIKLMKTAIARALRLQNRTNNRREMQQAVKKGLRRNLGTKLDKISKKLSKKPRKNVATNKINQKVISSGKRIASNISKQLKPPTKVPFQQMTHESFFNMHCEQLSSSDSNE